MDLSLRHKSSSLLLCAVVLQFLFFGVQSKCYYPGGNTEATDHIPCTDDNVFTHCCGVGQVCLSNGLCLVTYDMSLWMGSCSDITWDSSACFQEQSCKTVPSSGWSFYSPNLWHCNQNATQWACGNSDGSIANETCAKGEGFSLGATTNNPRVQNGSNVFPPGYTLVADSYQTSPAVNTSDNSTQQCFSEKSGVSVGGAVGVGLGVGIPLLLWALAMTFLVYRGRRQAKAVGNIGHRTETMDQTYVVYGGKAYGQESAARDVHEAPANNAMPSELSVGPKAGI